MGLPPGAASRPPPDGAGILAAMTLPDLEGWAAIADAIGRNERTARHYARRADDPLPVYKGLGRAVAYHAELEEWVRRQLTQK